MERVKNYFDGKTLLEILIAKDREALLFKTLEEPEGAVVKVDGDCCSQSWIEHVELPAGGFPALVYGVEDLDLPGSQNDHPEHDCLQVYGVKISTSKGDIIIDFRNSSNGYYGGSIVWPGESYYYGGVFGQNVSAEEWEAVLA